MKKWDVLHISAVAVDFFHQQQGQVFGPKFPHGNASVGFFEPKYLAEMEDNQYLTLKCILLSPHCESFPFWKDGLFPVGLGFWHSW